MIKRVLLAAGVVAAVAAAPASAGTIIKTNGSAASFAAPALPGGVVVDYNSSAGAPGFTTSGSAFSTFTGSSAGNYQEPAFSDGSAYLTVFKDGAYTLASTGAGYSIVSFFVGSLDVLNSVDILATDGSILASYTGTQLASPAPADGSATSNATNARLTYYGLGDTKAIGGIRFTTGVNSIEVDNVVFAVPEPTTWALMLAGFGMVGMMMRSRRRRTNVVFA